MLVRDEPDRPSTAARAVAGTGARFAYPSGHRRRRSGREHRGGGGGRRHPAGPGRCRRRLLALGRGAGRGAAGGARDGRAAPQRGAAAGRSRRSAAGHRGPGRAGAGARHRRDRPGHLPHRRGRARGAGAQLPRAHPDRQGRRPAAGHPRPRRARRRAAGAGRGRRAGHRGAALFLRRRELRGRVRQAGVRALLRRYRHLQERPEPARRGRRDPARPDPRGDRRTVPDPDALPGQAERLVPDPADGTGVGRHQGRGAGCLVRGHFRDRGTGLRKLERVSRLLGPAEIRELATRLRVRPTKTLGQNFVHDPNTVRRIVATAALQPDDVVVEVGPGLGSLTLGLLPAAAHVYAVEIDPTLAGQLPETVKDRAPAYVDRLTVLERDALRPTGAEVTGTTALVANLPYNVAVPVVLHLLATVPTIRHGLVMVQKEVADRLTAGPGSKVYGAPSAKLAWYATARSAGKVPPNVF